MDLRTLDAIVIDVHDGDTVTLDVNYPVRPRLRCVETMSIRLTGIQAPELKNPKPDVAARAVESMNFLKALILGKAVTVQFSGLDKFGGREDGVIFFGGLNVNQYMIDTKHAVAWNGKGLKPEG